MVVGLALSAIAGAIVTAVGLFPVVGAWSLLFAPFGGSSAAVAAGMMSAAVHDRLASGRDVDDMVGSLRAVLDDARGAETGPAAAPEPSHPTRIAG